MIYTPLFIVLFLMVFSLVWLFVNTIDRRKWLSFLISLLAAPVVYFYVFYPLLNIFCSYHHQKYFNSKDWIEKPSLRFEMSKNMINEGFFYGKSKKLLKNNLGAPEWFGWDATTKANSPQKWHYNLGFKPGAFNTMQECIEFVFKNDRVVSIQQYQLKQKFE